MKRRYMRQQWTLRFKYALAFTEWTEGRARLKEIGNTTFQKVLLDENGKGELRIP